MMEHVKVSGLIMMEIIETVVLFRVLLSMFASGESVVYRALVYYTEPFLVPFRLFLKNTSFGKRMGMDLSPLFVFFTLMLIRAVFYG
jgi:uncharacterized protein YggT (Ycf19 family)